MSLIEQIIRRLFHFVRWVELELLGKGNWEMCGECKRFSSPRYPYCPYCQ